MKNLLISFLVLLLASCGSSDSSGDNAITTPLEVQKVQGKWKSDCTAVPDGSYIVSRADINSDGNIYYIDQTFFNSLCSGTPAATEENTSPYIITSNANGKITMEVKYYLSTQAPSEETLFKTIEEVFFKGAILKNRVIRAFNIKTNGQLAELPQDVVKLFPMLNWNKTN